MKNHLTVSLLLVFAVLLAPLCALAPTPDQGPGPAKISINKATAAEWTALPGVGPKMAERIVAYRTQNGPFKRVEDLMRVKGIGEKLFQKWKERLTL